MDHHQLPDRLKTAPAHAVEAVVALGSNVGDSRRILADAVERFRTHAQLDIVAVSPLAKTAPVGGPQQPDFLNQVLIVTTTLAPSALLQFAHDLENQAGRARDIRWGPRTLDVDIITYDGVISDHPELLLPHPRAHERAFVLAPWSWADPTATLHGTPVTRLAAQADDAATVQRLDEQEDNP